MAPTVDDTPAGTAEPQPRPPRRAEAAAARIGLLFAKDIAGQEVNVDRDRHGRTARSDNDPRRRPSDGFRVNGARFPRIVADAIAALPQRFARQVAGARLRVEDIPPPPMVGPDGEVLLAGYDGAVLTIYRRPVESRAENRTTLEETLMIAVGQAVARHAGWDDDIDDLFTD